MVPEILSLEKRLDVLGRAEPGRVVSHQKWILHKKRKILVPIRPLYDQWRNFRNILGGANVEKMNRRLKFRINLHAMINFNFSYLYYSLGPFEL